MIARIRRHLIDDDEAPGETEIAAYTEVKAFLRKQAENGGFPARAPERALGGARFSACLATLRALDRLADFGLSVATPAVATTAEVLLDSQRKDGAIADLALGATRQARAREPAPHFHGWAVAALSRVGLDGDSRVTAAFQYLLHHRQADGGWAWRGVRADSPARPSSHLATGMALRAFAASPAHRVSREARRAAELLATRFMQPDRYPDRRAAAYWETLSEPRFYTDLLDALDSVTAVGLGKENAGVRIAEAYLRSRQDADGLWYPGPARPDAPPKERDAARWLTVRMLSVLRRVN